MKSGTPRPPSNTRRHRRVLLYLIGCFVIGGLVWSAPTLIVKSPLKSTIINLAADGFGGDVSVGSISTGWLSPIVVHDIDARSKQGEPVFQVLSIRTQKPLAALLVNRTQLGTILIDQPQVNLNLRPDGSNLEDFIRPWRGQPSTSRFDWRGEISQGKIAVTDSDTGKQWSIDDVSLTIDSRGTTEPTMHTTLRAAVAGASGSGNLAADILWHGNSGDNEPGIGSGTATLKTNALPLAMCEGRLRHLLPRIQLQGLLSGGLELEWGGDAGEVLKMENISVQQFAFAAPTWIGEDRVAVESMDLRGGVRREGDRWQIEELVLESPLVSLRADGSGRRRHKVSQDRGLPFSDLLEQASFQVDAKADVARIAQTLRSTLRIRDTVQLSSGAISASVNAQPFPDGQRWQMQITGEKLTGKHQGRDIRLDAPIAIQLDARRAGDSFSLEEFSCSSSFLTLSGKASSTEGSVQLKGDLNQFVKEINRFADLSDITLTGALTADMGWRRGAQGTIVVEGDAAAEQFELNAGGNQPWREQRLKVKLKALGVADSLRAGSLQQATIRLESSGDALQAELSEPIARLSWDENLPLRVQMEGELESWLPRIQRLVPLAGWSIAGEMKGNARVLASLDTVECKSAQFTVRNLNAKSLKLHVREPELQVEGSGKWDGIRHELLLDSMTLATSTLAFRAEQFHMVTQLDDFRLAGAIGYRADLSRLATLFSDPHDQPAWRFGGEAEGHLRLEQNSESMSGQWSTNVKNFRAATNASTTGNRANSVNQWTTQWHEPSISFIGQGQYNLAKDTIKLDQVQIKSDSVVATASGSLSQPRTRCFVDIAGQLECDLPRIGERLSAQLGSGIRLAGHGTRPFTFRGPLLPSEDGPTRVITTSTSDVSSSGNYATKLEAQASLAWDSAHVHGFQFGSGELQGSLTNGIIEFQPIELPLNEGKVTLTTRVLLNNSPAVLQVARGPIAEQIRITPNICQGWLKYIAPLVADATTAQGRFSVSLDSATIPLGDKNSSNVSGELFVHEARLGPGAVTRDLIRIAEQVRAIAKGRPLSAANRGSQSWLDLPEQKIAFQMVEGRVYHRGLRMNLQDVSITTHGSVGVDQSLSVVAEVPVRDEWVTGNRYLGGLKGQVIQIPIQGSLSKPRVDRRIVENLASQAARDAAAKLLEKEIGRGLEKLFSPN